MAKFWMAVRDHVDATAAKKYLDREEAKQEAERLASVNGATYYLMEAVAIAKPATQLPVTWHDV